MEAFRTLNNEGITILMATHNAALLSYCSRRLDVRDGSVTERPPR
jgi:ABC-type lipoprotein export system ATPase subunit